MFIQENVFEIVVKKLAAILSRPQCVNVCEIPEHWNHEDTDKSSII